MTAFEDFDRLVTSWLEADGAADVRPEVVDTALTSAGIVSQRHGVRAWLVGANRWPVDGRRLTFTALPPTARVATILLVLALTLTVIVAAIAGAIRSDPTKLLSGRNGAIAYTVSDIQARPYSHFHLANADGTDDHEVAQGACPTFSRNGSLLSYWSGSAETRELVIANADGSSPKVVPFVKGRSAIAGLSPDFSQVAWLKQVDPNTRQDAEVWVTPVSGGPGIRIAPKSDIPGESYSDPLWSPDGRHVAFGAMTSVDSPGGSNSGSYRSSIYVADVGGSRVRRLSARPGWDTIQLSWSPDSRYLAYDGTPDGSPLPSLGDDTADIASLYPPLDIFVIGADGTGERNLTNTNLATERGPEWSPDGSHLAYHGPFVDGDQGWPIATVRMADGVAVGQAVIGPVTAEFLWSPDGTSLLLSDSRETSNGAQIQTFDSQIRSIDAELEEAPVALLSNHLNLIACLSWQRLEP